ncbi:leucine-rich repeat domain-containing protein [bacterium]|nr:leucine-rich repeat domain-containing protein [bacterium]
MFLRATLFFVLSVASMCATPSKVSGIEEWKRMIDRDRAVTVHNEEEAAEFFGLLESDEDFRKYAGGVVDTFVVLSNSEGSLLKRIPKSIQYLWLLKDFRIFESDIERLPNEIGELVMLERITIYNSSKLWSLPETVGNLVNLTVLNFCCEDKRGSLEFLPSTIGNLTKLRALTVRNASLRCLPDSICNLESLELLDVENNWILELPSGLGRLKNLKKLVASLNCFKSLPVLQPGDFASIEEIHLHNNSNLSSFPWDVSKMPFLKLLALNCPKEYRQKNFLIHLSVAEWMRVDGHCYSGPREDDVFMSDAWCTIS